MCSTFDDFRREYNGILKKAFQTQDCEIIERTNELYSSSNVDLKSPLDQVFRDVLLELLEDETDVLILQKLVTFCIETCRKHMTTPTMPVVLLGDIFDALPLDGCEDMFTFVENEVNVWKEDLFFTSCKNNLLRMCNDLLRRLSRSHTTTFCGRILLFLAKFFPFSERSGLNIVSEFNLENVTEYGTDESEEAATAISVGGDKNIVIDYSLYCKFWSLQDFFRNPNQCYVKVQWKTFCSHASSILSTFSGLKLDYIHNEEVTGAGEEKFRYFAKYLTNQKLLDLQIYDVNFRRFVLLQFLILFQYLTSSVKFKAETFTLKSDQTDWIRTTTDKIYALLKETPPDGEKFVHIVKHVMQREEHWNVWKNDGCPEFKKSLPITENIEETTDKRRPGRPKRNRHLLGDIIKDATLNNKYYMGNQELTKLWNLSPDNLEACKAKDRDFLPSLESYFEEAIEQLEITSAVKEENKCINDGNFGWRALRLLARRSPHFFTYGNNPINKLPDYLDMMVQKIAKDRPDRNQDNMETFNQNEVEMDEDLLKDTEEEPNPGTEDKTNLEEFTDDTNAPREVIQVTQEHLDAIVDKLGEDWKKLGSKLGFKPDEIAFFQTENETNQLRARNMLQIWFEDDVDATLENLCYYLEGLELKDVADVVRTFL